MCISDALTHEGKSSNYTASDSLADNHIESLYEDAEGT